jgi:hypothetical protein
MKMTRKNLRELSAAMTEALAGLEERFSVRFAVGGGRYSESEVTYKVTASAVGENGETYSREAEKFTLLAETYGLKPEWLGKEFSSNGEKFRVTGLKTSRRKYPVSAVKIASGREYKFAASFFNEHTMGV